ncbi:GNAT family N-acetyltransferase [Echinimonas agarilytica]|uniref:GNAT family N-acetyltransferase n=1 Tax=Echinimonas agarilytica TaxID=1215918 RepID=A0AA42B8X2_9GAMM|nr:GNAT family N-acetyltransferase [Echinimonas agarilytica]MCM2681504.1 GNAT family N-acetyltransferase [Echinimonas agarilytica]
MLDTNASEATNIELTDAWQQCLYKHCFSPSQVLHYARSFTGDKETRYAYVRSISNSGLKRIAPLRNYFVTHAAPRTPLSPSQTMPLFNSLLEQPWHMATIGLASKNNEFIQQIQSYLKAQRIPFKLEPQFTNWQLRLDVSPEEYFAQRPSQLKNTLKRKKNKLLREQRQWHCQLVSSVESFERGFADYKSIYDASWKPVEENISFIKEFSKLAAERGWLRMALLYIDNEPAAAQIWFNYQGKTNIFKLAYHPKFKNYSAGTLLTEFLMRHVLEQDSVKWVDFGMGDEPYKQDWMNISEQCYTVTAFNNRSFFGTLARIRYDILPRLKQRLLR